MSLYCCPRPESVPEDLVGYFHAGHLNCFRKAIHSAAPYAMTGRYQVPHLLPISKTDAVPDLVPHVCARCCARCVPDVVPDVCPIMCPKICFMCPKIGFMCPMCVPDVSIRVPIWVQNRVPDHVPEDVPEDLFLCSRWGFKANHGRMHFTRNVKNKSKNKGIKQIFGHMKQIFGHMIGHTRSGTTSGTASGTTSVTISGIHTSGTRSGTTAGTHIGHNIGHTHRAQRTKHRAP